MPDERLRVMNYTLEKNVFDEDVITALIETLHLPYKYIAEKGKKPELPNNEESWRLVKVLKERDYISSYSETKKGIRVNTKLQTHRVKSMSLSIFNPIFISQKCFWEAPLPPSAL